MSAERWRFTVEGSADPETNMALDWAMLQRAEEGEWLARIYSWSSVSVTLGRGQTPETVFLREPWLPWALRPTGGSAVLHGHDLTLGMAFPVRRSVRDTYRRATAPILRALNAVGPLVCLAEDLGAAGPRLLPADCFAAKSATDIVSISGGSKVCGCALRRTASAVLLQASIPLGPPLLDPREILRDGAAPHWSEFSRDAFIDAFREALKREEGLDG